MFTRAGQESFEGVVDPADVVEIEAQADPTGGVKLYIHINGETRVRIGRIKTELVITLPDVPNGN